MQPDNKILDFFRPKISLEKEKNPLVKLGAMTLYTFSSMVSRAKWTHLGVAIAVGLSGAVVTDYVYHGNERMAMEQQKMTYLQEQYEKKEKKILLEKKITDEQGLAKKNQQIEYIKSIKPEQIEAIQAYIIKTKEKELNKLKEVYWTYVFIANNDARLDFSEVNTLIRNQMNNVNSFYQNRAYEISSTYDYVRSGKTELISPTFDDQNPLDKILYWSALTKTNQFSYMDSTDKLIAKSTTYLRSPQKLAQYLKENKDMIDNHKMFD